MRGAREALKATGWRTCFQRKSCSLHRGRMGISPPKGQWKNQWWEDEMETSRDLASKIKRPRRKVLTNERIGIQAKYQVGSKWTNLVCVREWATSTYVDGFVHFKKRERKRGNLFSKGYFYSLVIGWKLPNVFVIGSLHFYRPKRWRHEIRYLGSHMEQSQETFAIAAAATSRQEPRSCWSRRHQN